MADAGGWLHGKGVVDRYGTVCHVPAIHWTRDTIIIWALTRDPTAWGLPSARHVPQPSSQIDSYIYVRLIRMKSLALVCIIMAALRIADADIIFLPSGFYFFLLFFHRLISAVGDWMSTILPDMVWP